MQPEQGIKRVRQCSSLELGKKNPFNIFELMVVFLLEIQIDICAEEMGNNVRPAAMLLGDINAVTKQVM